MQPDEYGHFTERLRERISKDGRAIGLVALGSMSGEPPAADDWSDHDFFVITRPGEQEGLRNDLSWLPDAGEIAFTYRDTPHGVKVFYRSAHLLELAVFDLDEMVRYAKINRARTLLDRGGVDEAVQHLRRRRPERRDTRWLSGEILGTLLVASNRARRGELLSSRELLYFATLRLAELIAQSLPREGALDSLNPLRRFELAFPQLGGELNAALQRPPGEAARLLLGVALRQLPDDFPAEAARAIERHLR
jgi:hypothetical protein